MADQADEDWSHVGFTAGICFIMCMGAFFLAKIPAVTALQRIEGVVMRGLTGVVISLLMFPPRHQERMKSASGDLHGIYQKVLRLVLLSLSGDLTGSQLLSGTVMKLGEKALEYKEIASDMAWNPFMGRKARQELS